MEVVATADPDVLEVRGRSPGGLARLANRVGRRCRDLDETPSRGIQRFGDERYPIPPGARASCDVPDFPSPGIVFRTITPLWSNSELFAAAIETMSALFRARRDPR